MAAALYFYLWTPEAPASILAAGVKSAPILLLAAVVLSWNGGQSVLGVVGGLVFSAVGDCCLVWPELFLHGKSCTGVTYKLKCFRSRVNGFSIFFLLIICQHISVSGMGAFAVAHLLYSLAFLSSRYATYSSSSWTRFLYLILVMVGGGFYMYLYPFLQKAPKSEILTPAVGVYVVIIVLMGTLAVRSRRYATLLGSLFFMASDLTLAMQEFKVTTSLEHSQTIVMVTYYLAQLLIAVGDVWAVENKDDFAKWKRS